MQFYITVGITAACGLPVVGSAAMHHARHAASKHWQSMAEGRFFFPSPPLISKFKEQKTMLSNLRCVLLCILVTVPPNPEVKLMVHGKKNPVAPLHPLLSLSTLVPCRPFCHQQLHIPQMLATGDRTKARSSSSLNLREVGDGFYFTLHSSGQSL